MARERKRRKRNRAGIWISLVLILVMTIVIAAGAYWYMYANVKALNGKWNRAVDITNETVVNITKYLNEAALGNEIVVTEYVGRLTIEIDLEIDRDGNWIQSVNYDSYEHSKQQAKKALKQAVEDLIMARIDRSYIETSASADELVEKTIGMKLDSYLDKYAPEIITPYETLQEKYSVSMKYEADRNKITFLDVAGDESYNYAVANGMLAIDYGTESVIYHSSDAISTEDNGIIIENIE